MKKYMIFIAAMLSLSGCSYEGDVPFGWATCTSLEGGNYELTGGGHGSSITLKSTGEDMRDAIVDAVNSYDVIILDGSNGLFPISTTMVLDSVKNKTIVGINGAYLRSISQITPEILEYIEANEGKYRNDIPDAKGNYHMPVGNYATSNLEAYTRRRALYDYTGDPEEKFCHSGMFTFNNSENIILRNIAFEGTGRFRALPDNMIRILKESNHIWIDHCSFTDPSRCCMSAGSAADFITVTRCIYRFTERSDGGETYGFLISSSDNSSKDVGHLNITIAHCFFDNVWGRPPMARYGHIHVLNNYYDNPKMSGINPRTESSFLVENNYFEDGTNAFCAYHIDINVPTAHQWKGNRFGNDNPVEGKGTVIMPYAYQALPAEAVKEDVLSDCGPVLENPLRIR